MILDVYLYKCSDDAEILTGKEIGDIAHACFNECGVKTGHIFLNFNYVNREEMVKANKKFRKQNHATNVLSFEPKAVDRKSLYEDNENINFYLGDLLVNKDIVEEEAKKLNCSVRDRCIMLCAHGILHLLGFNHKTKEDEQKMYEIQDKICRRFGLKEWYHYNVYDVKDED